MAFTDKVDLINQLKHILTMSDDEIKNLRTNVINYYIAHLHPLKIREKFLDERNSVLVFAVNVLSTKAFQRSKGRIVKI